MKQKIIVKDNLEKRDLEKEDSEIKIAKEEKISSNHIRLLLNTDYDEITKHYLRVGLSSNIKEKVNFTIQLIGVGFKDNNIIQNIYRFWNIDNQHLIKCLLNNRFNINQIRALTLMMVKRPFSISYEEFKFIADYRYSAGQMNTLYNVFKNRDITVDIAKKYFSPLLSEKNIEKFSKNYLQSIKDVI